MAVTTLYSVAGAVGRGGCNVLVNAATAYLAGYANFNSSDLRREIATIVAIDTTFRIAITHLLDALKIPFLEKGTAGHLLFPCLTLLTQPLSAKIAERYFEWSKQEFSIRLFGFIALSWKANMMLKDVLYLTGLLKV